MSILFIGKYIHTHRINQILKIGILWRHKVDWEPTFFIAKHLFYQISLKRIAKECLLWLCHFDPNYPDFGYLYCWVWENRKYENFTTLKSTQSASLYGCPPTQRYRVRQNFIIQKSSQTIKISGLIKIATVRHFFLCLTTHFISENASMRWVCWKHFLCVFVIICRALALNPTKLSWVLRAMACLYFMRQLL